MVHEPNRPSMSGRRRTEFDKVSRGMIKALHNLRRGKSLQGMVIRKLLEAPDFSGDPTLLAFAFSYYIWWLPALLLCTSILAFVPCLSAPVQVYRLQYRFNCATEYLILEVAVKLNLKHHFLSFTQLDFSVCRDDVAFEVAPFVRGSSALALKII